MLYYSQNLKKNPREIAEILQNNLMQSSLGQYLETVTIAGPGFLNLVFHAIHISW